MMRCFFMAAALAMVLPAPASAAVRALFVGIDHYRYSTAHVPEAEFADLAGAVGDVGRIKEAMRAAYALDLDPGPKGNCAARNAVSITLTDDCADRASILAGLADRIAASTKGDTVVFYYAGHGSRFRDDVEFRAASGYNDTILASDARKPGAPESGDILDREFRTIIDAATTRGVNIWTIFDSCNSGTATREGAQGSKRSAPDLIVPKVIPSPDQPPPSGSQYGYRVHFGASMDTEESWEARGAGVFTTALVEALPVLAHATFDDIATEVALKVAASGNAAQHPQAEGALDETLGGAVAREIVLRAKPEGTGVTLLAGKLSGMTAGSRVAIFARRIDALDDKAQSIATGGLASVDPLQSTVVLDAPPVHALPQTLAVRETQHAWGMQKFVIGVRSPDTALSAAVASAIAPLGFAQLGTSSQYYVQGRIASDPQAVLYAADGTNGVKLGDYRDPAFPMILRDGLQKIAHVEALLALRTDPTLATVRFCVATGTYDVSTCPPPDWKRGHVLALGERAQITVKVLGEEKRFVYVLGIDPKYEVQVLLPQHGGRDPALNAHTTPLASAIGPRLPGHYRFVTIATDAEIDAAALEQSGAGARDPAQCQKSTLAALLCEAATGTRDPATPHFGNWSAIVEPVLVEQRRATP